MDQKTVDAILNELTVQEAGWFANQIATTLAGKKKSAHDFAVMGNAVANAARGIQALVEKTARQAPVTAAIIQDGEMIHQTVAKKKRTPAV